MNIATVLEMAAGAYGDRGAVASADGEVSYEGMLANVVARASELKQQAEKAGAEHVVYIGLSGQSFVEHLLASAWAGLPFIPLNYRIKAEELEPLLEPFHPVLFVHDEQYTDKAKECTSPEDVLLTPDQTLPADAPAEQLQYPDDPEQLAVILYTSGTTSAPKAVLLRHRHLCSYIFGTVQFGISEPGETALLTVPPYHIAGIMGVLTPLYSGRRMVFMPQFEATEWLKNAAQFEVTHAFLVPTMLARIADVLDADPSLTPPSLRHLAYGGGPIHLALVERLLALFPDVDFVNAYGLTETSSTVALLTPEDHRKAFAATDPEIKARLGSVGKPLPGIDVMILDEDGNETPTGEPGDITLGGAQVSGEYRGRETPSGRFITGDVGYVDSEGYLFIGARSDDVIIRGGENISPGEIEDVFARHEDVSSIAVVGVPDMEWGQRIVAYIEPRNEDHASGEELRAWAKPNLAGFKLPVEFFFIDELPRNDTGKVLRTKLRERYSHDSAEAV